jgi:dTDP-4-amino-4,6-dideoxygalactose transaminase
MNGSVALRIALIAAGIQEGDEVIVPAYTFIATASSVIEANAVPVFVDIDPETYCLTPQGVEASITDRTRAIIPVHFAGQAVDMDPLMALADRYNLVVIEDAAHAHGAEYKSRRLGSIAQMGCFSFQSSKNLTAGEGGAILTNDEQYERLCRSLHTCGRYPEGAWYEHYQPGGNYRMTEFQAGLLLNQLTRLEEQTKLRDRNGYYLNQRLVEIPGIRPLKRGLGETRHAYHLYIFRGYGTPIYRQELFLKLAFGPYTGYQHTQPDLDYAGVYCPVSETACREEACWLPQSVLLGSEKDMDDICYFKDLRKPEGTAGMKAGVSQVCITPPVGVDLCGYVEREQPSVGVLDDLYVRGLYLETDEERLLWLNCDLICFSPKRVRLLREVCRIAHGLFRSRYG